MKRALILLLLILPLMQVSAQDVLKVGDSAPELNLTAEDGSKVDLSGVTVLVFASPYCPHCRNELPALSRAWKASGIGDKAKVVVIMYTGQGLEKAKEIEMEFWKEIDPPDGWVLVREPPVEVIKEYKVYAVPLTYVIADGKIQGTYLGEGRHGQVIERVAELLGLQVTQVVTESTKQKTTQTAEGKEGSGFPKALIVVAAVVVVLTAYAVWKYKSTMKKLSKR